MKKITGKHYQLSENIAEKVLDNWLSLQPEPEHINQFAYYIRHMQRVIHLYHKRNLNSQL